MFIQGGAKAILKHPHLEADDCIAISVKHLTQKYPSCQIYIITSDHDYLQLNSPNVHLFNLSFKNLTESKTATGNANQDLQLKIITGDNAITTKAIAKQIGLNGFETSISGDDLMKLKDDELKNCVMNTSIFTRMFPEAKLRIINALKANNQVVAMTGDGVNDGPALKAAHIGIAMGIKGTEIAKQASSLILLEDNISKMVDAVAMGRKIYSNLKKAIQYIISIHIPIILTVFIPLALGWIYPNLFSPIHILFLEIIMGPTCSIIYENEPMQANTMLQKPKPLTTTFFNWRELSISIVQGLFITAGTLFVYQYSVINDYKSELDYYEKLRTPWWSSDAKYDYFLSSA
jgi:Ca2+-transporting ATPase